MAKPLTRRRLINDARRPIVSRTLTRPFGQKPFDRFGDVGRVEWLCEILICAGFEEEVLDTVIVDAGDDADDGGGPGELDARKELDPVDVWKIQVEEHDIRRVAGKDLVESTEGLDRRDLMLVLAQKELQNVAKLWVVVDNKDARHGDSRQEVRPGSRRPSPASDTICAIPPNITDRVFLEG